MAQLSQQQFQIILNNINEFSLTRDGLFSSNSYPGLEERESNLGEIIIGKALLNNEQFQEIEDKIINIISSNKENWFVEKRNCVNLSFREKRGSGCHYFAAFDREKVKFLLGELEAVRHTYTDENDDNPFFPDPFRQPPAEREFRRTVDEEINSAGLALKKKLEPEQNRINKFCELLKNSEKVKEIFVKPNTGQPCECCSNKDLCPHYHIFFCLNTQEEIITFKNKMIEVHKEIYEKVLKLPNEKVNEPSNNINSVTVKNHEDLDYIETISNISKRVEKDIYSKFKRDMQTCDYCQKQFKGKWDGHGYVSYGAIGKDGHKTFCSEECREKGMKGKWLTVVKKNTFTELLKWMEKEGITNISLDPDSGKLVIEYGKNNSQTIEDDKLTSEQREIKEFFKQTGKNQLSRNQVREEIKKESKGGDNNKWLGPVVGFGIVALIIVFVGIIIYKNKKKNY